MAQVKLEDVILDRLIDVIQNGAKDSDLRDEYDRFMSQRNYNNPDMVALHEHCIKMVELGWAECRNDRDEDRLIEQCCDEAVGQGIAIWVMGDKQLANSIEDDRVWRDIQASARAWDGVEDDYERATRRGGRDDRGGRGGRNDRDDRRGGGRNTGLGYNQSRPPMGGSGRDDRGSRDRGDSRMTGGFGSGGRGRNDRDDRDSRSTHVPRESARNADDNQQRSRRDSSPLARPARQQETQEVERHESRLQRHQETDDVIELNAGPDLNSDRPFDDFWDNGENWQLAHVSDFVWQWSPQQQMRRSYDAEQEVRFLVKGVDGKVREEFLPMTDQLSFAANEIKALTRPNDGRRTRDTVGAIADDITLPGRDIDAVDLDVLGVKMDEVRRTLITELNLTSNVLADSPAYASTLRDGLIRATSLRLQSGKDIAAVQNIVIELLPSSGAGRTELESLGNLIGADADLTTLQKRLQALRGKVDESVLDNINEHYTAEVNHSLNHAFGFGGKLAIESFIDDFADMLAVMTKHRNPGYTSQYLSRTRNLVPTLAIMSEAQGRKDVIASLDLLPEAEEDSTDYITYRENMIVVLKSSASVSIAVDLVAFGVVDDVPRVALGNGEGADPELRDALNSLYLVARKASPPGRVHVITADNVTLELVGIAGARDVVGVRRA